MYRVTTDSDVFGYDQYDYRTKTEALAGLMRLVKSALKRDDGVARRYTVEKTS